MTVQEATKSRAPESPKGPKGIGTAMKAYKPDQGRMARMFAFWGLEFLVLFGCTTLHTALSTMIDGWDEALGGMSIPVLGVDVSIAFLVSSAIFLVGTVALFRWQQQPKVADLLIETEGEMKKVTWPKMNEVTNSSLVVIALVLILMGYLAGADWVFGRLMNLILLGVG